MAKLSVKGLGLAYESGGPFALKGFDLEIEAGETIVLVGPSGCGKSTALKLIAGLDDPSEGSIHLDGRSLGGVPPQDRDVAMVFQGYALYPHMTVADNIAFPLKMRKIPTDKRKAMVGEIAELLGLAKLLTRLPEELSGGERQRVAIGRALVRRPKLFLFDEPLSNLDAALRQTLRVELKKLFRTIDATVIYVTHDQTEAMTLADRVVVMRKGEILQVGTPKTVYAAPKNQFVAAFLGHPEINLVKLPWSEGHVAIGARRLPCPLRTPRAHVVLGLRPEHVRCGPEGVPAKLEATEPLGASTILHLTLEDAPFGAVRVLASGFVEPHDTTVQLTWEASDALWFDAESGSSLVPGDD